MFEHENDTIAAVCTGTGGAVSIIRISGPRALDIVRSVWRGKRMPGPDCPRVMLYGRLVSGSKDEAGTGGNGAGEPSLAVFMPGPRSFTGEDVAEIHCHGGSFAARRAPAPSASRRARLAAKLPPWQWISATSSPVKLRGPGMKTASEGSPVPSS